MIACSARSRRGRREGADEACHSDRAGARAARQCGCDRGGGGRAQARGAATRGVGRRHSRARAARRHLQEAWAAARDSLHVGRARIDPGTGRRQRRPRDRFGRLGRIRHVRQGRADPHHRQRDHRRPRSLLVRSRWLADPEGRGLQRQIRRYSLTGSSSHAGLLALIAQYHLQARPTSTGSISATITQTMTGQVDVGFGAVPYGLDMVADGRIRIIAGGNDVIALRTRTARVNLTNLATLTTRKDVLKRFIRAYRETVDWMYADPAALRIYGEFSGMPDAVVQRVRPLMPKDSMATEHVVGVDQIMADAVQNRFLAAPLTREQLAELIRTDELQ